MSKKIVIGITHGDINGIGYELIINTFQDTRMLDFCTPVIYGSSKVLAYYRKVLNSAGISVNNINSAKDLNPKRINLVNCVDDEIKVELGLSTRIAGEAAASALGMAVAEVKSGFVDALVTCPINKENIQSEKFSFPGHTEYLQDAFDGSQSLMLMVSERVRIGVVTGHIPLKDVSEALTPEMIEGKIRILNHTLKQDFNIRKPRIAVLGLNPHAGDDGVIGNEDKEIIAPVINKLRDNGILAMGPYAADGFFGTDDYNKFDGIMAMYHDQGLIPFKLLAMHDGVNFTAGLSAVRTSPAHGTAYNIAGEGVANIQSFREAVYCAIDVCKNRTSYQEVNKNPLRKQHAIDPNKVRDVSVQELEKEVGNEKPSEE